MYTALVPIILYVAIVQGAQRYGWKPASSSLAVVIGTQLFDLIMRAILASRYANETVLVSPVTVVLALLQFIFAYAVFRLLQHYEESYVAWIVWTMVGLVAVFAIAPMIADRLVGLF